MPAQVQAYSARCCTADTSYTRPYQFLRETLISCMGCVRDEKMAQRFYRSPCLPKPLPLSSNFFHSAESSSRVQRFGIRNNYASYGASGLVCSCSCSCSDSLRLVYDELVQRRPILFFMSSIVQYYRLDFTTSG